MTFTYTSPRSWLRDPKIPYTQIYSYVIKLFPAALNLNRYWFLKICLVKIYTNSLEDRVKRACVHRLCTASGLISEQPVFQLFCQIVQYSEPSTATVDYMPTNPFNNLSTYSTSFDPQNTWRECLPWVEPEFPRMLWIISLEIQVHSSPTRLSAPIYHHCKRYAAYRNQASVLYSMWTNPCK